MRIAKPTFRAVAVVAVCSIVLFTAGCNRAGVRILGASLPFPESATYYKAAKSNPYPIVVLSPTDNRPQHYGEHVAGTKWTGCSTDALWSKDASTLIQERIAAELTSSGLFPEVKTISTGPNDLIMKTDIHAFCSQAVGVLIIRVAGIISLTVTVEQNGKAILEQKFEKGVTDADKEYTGSQVTTIEQAMARTMSDSLREVMKQILIALEKHLPRSEG
jgi:hypothetical protein